ncbi:MAG: hypothetical protein HY980_04300 [Candidatus Magasanikbacteria bacterium]|nr:hypothetical protein [Candidatus Magasanikbacteria bacterium]
MATEDKDAKFRKYLAGLAKKSAEKMAEQEPWRDAKPNSLVGWDLGLCVADILEGRGTEQQVRKIFIARFLNDDESGWEQLIGHCKKTCWKKDPVKGEAIARRLRVAGKVIKSDESPSIGLIGGWLNVGDNVDVRVTKEPW